VAPDRLVVQAGAGDFVGSWA